MRPPAWIAAPASCLVAIALAAGTPAAAFAQARTGGSLDPALERRVTAELSLGAWEPTLARDIVVSSLAVYPSGRVGVWADEPGGLGTIELDGSLRGFFGEFYDEVGTAHYFTLGGATLGLMFGWSDRAHVRVRVGPAIVVPFAMLDTPRKSVEQATYYGRATSGFWDPWDGFARGPGAFLRADLDLRHDAWIGGVELGAGPSFWLAEGRDGGLLEVPVAVAYYQAGAYLGAHALDWLALGARVQVVGWSEGGGAWRFERRPAEAQVAIVPFARFLLAPWFVELRGTLNLGEPEGVGSRSLVWAVRAALGVELGP